MSAELLQSLQSLSLSSRHRSRHRHRGSRSTKHLYLLRGLPGSGKTTLARSLKHQFPAAVILSTDDYFVRDDGSYLFERDLLGDAHEWNFERAKAAMKRGKTPIIIDNTNIQAWEMKPYVHLALENAYEVIFREPDTHWKFNIRQLERRNIHGVSREKIERMKEQYEWNVSVNDVLYAERPARNNRSQSCQRAGFGGRNWNCSGASYSNSGAPPSNTGHTNQRVTRNSRVRNRF
ncbi:NEDD4-binding protein 2-like 1 [Callorhinchus milii]|uniref:NEDD4-binding protein 2-like 1-like protein n=1 Tax=Callorhinchus milii TaxID=7868 RepID=V9KJV3_CALMI|nr:NEDD4-binding protein 2-like 1 [Callorhinchus milii]|eukprot:gi/632948222/ref/XP_007889473.1/ PREDICTED: NEDD4-binding protein 2-like 1 [Callorhinchus milii]